MHSNSARDWTEAEITLIKEVAERTWAAAERARAEQAMRESEEKYRSVFEAIDEGFALIEVIFDPQGKPVDLLHLETNQAYERHTGLRDVVGKRALEIAPDFDTQWFDFYGQVARTGEAARTESLIPPVDRWITLHASRVGGEGSRKIAVVFNDITDRKVSEIALRESNVHQQLLLAELQHRVRNTLAIVRSIAQRTADKSENVEEMLSHFRGRLDAFSRVQSALTRGVSGTVSLITLIEDELVAHAAREGEQVSIEGLEVKTAERLSLAIHELTTNAVKHGALTSDKGRIRINWKREQATGSARVLLNWKESGVEVEENPEREGFGMELLLRSLPYDVQGETKVALHRHGLEFDLSMPLREPVEIK